MGVDMRFSVLLVRVAAFFGVARPALVSPAIADDVCDRGTGEASIAACTRIIQDRSDVYGKPRQRRRDESRDTLALPAPPLPLRRRAVLDVAAWSLPRCGGGSGP
jgi:hypothetical protein